MSYGNLEWPQTPDANIVPVVRIWVWKLCSLCVFIVALSHCCHIVTVYPTRIDVAYCVLAVLLALPPVGYVLMALHFQKNSENKRCMDRMIGYGYV